MKTKKYCFYKANTGKAEGLGKWFPTALNTWWVGASKSAIGVADPSNSPALTIHATGALDPSTSKFYIFGGVSGSGLYIGTGSVINELWVLNLNVTGIPSS